MTNQLIQQLETLPAFLTLSKGLKENFNADNFYIRHFMPEAVSREKIDGVNLIYSRSDEVREKIAKENLLDDNDEYFDEFIHETNLRNDVTEFMRTIVKEMYRDRRI